MVVCSQWVDFDESFSLFSLLKLKEETFNFALAVYVVLLVFLLSRLQGNFVFVVRVFFFCPLVFVLFFGGSEPVRRVELKQRAAGRSARPRSHRHTDSSFFTLQSGAKL